MITSSNTMALNNHCATALGPRLGLGLRLDFGSQVWFVQYFSEKKVIVLYGRAPSEAACFACRVVLPAKNRFVNLPGL